MLEIKELCKSFINNGISKNVLRDISVQVPAGEFLCVLGQSGSGKTTLMRCIAGYEKPTQGQLSLNGLPISEPGTDRIMVFQGFEQLLAWKNVAANVEYPLIINKAARPKRRELVDKYLKMVDLQDYKSYYPHQLSGGMKQRTAIARALALEPQVLLMDEPFGHLDAQTRSALQNKLLGIWTILKSTVIFVTHDIEEAILLSDRILILSNAGRIKSNLVNPLKRPRHLGMDGFSRLWNELYEALAD